MRTFIIKARKGSTRWDKLRSQVASDDHFEVVAHTVMNAFFISKGFREEVEVYIVLDSSEDFPRTIHLQGDKGLSLAGFHEEAVLELVERALKQSQGLQKDQTLGVAPGVEVSAYGFEKLLTQLLETRPVYLLSPKGEEVQNIKLESNPVFVLSDHLAMPKNLLKSFRRRGAKMLSLGKTMLFASQCVVLLHYELDKR